MCRGCGHAKCANLALGTGLEEQDETRNFWECQNNNQIISKFIFMACRLDLIMKLEKFIFYR